MASKPELDTPPNRVRATLEHRTRNEVCLVAISRGEEMYAFTYRNGQEALVVAAICRQVVNPQLSLSIVDGCKLSKQVRELTK